MSWHCLYCGSQHPPSGGENPAWLNAHISAPFSMMVPFSVVFHVECYLETVPEGASTVHELLGDLIPGDAEGLNYED